MSLMRKTLFVGAAAVALAGAGGLAYAQTPASVPADTHVMNIRLPDGSLQRIEYTGNVPPRIEIVPVSRLTPAQMRVAESPFAMMQRISAEMDAQMAQMFQAFGPMMGPFGSAPVTASFGGMPMAGSGVCVHSVQVTYNGSGQPNVVSRTAGDCGGAAAKSSAPAALPTTPVPPAAQRTIQVKDEHPVGQPAYRALVIPASDDMRG
jgi:hypothetical protein